MNGPRSEIRDWYTRRLRPKVVDAARSGAIPPARAAELERQMNDLLAPLTRRRSTAAAAISRRNSQECWTRT